MKYRWSTDHQKLRGDKEICFLLAAIRAGCSFQQYGKWENRMRQTCFSRAKPKIIWWPKFFMKVTSTSSENCISNEKKRETEIQRLHKWQCSSFVIFGENKAYMTLVKLMSWTCFIKNKYATIHCCSTYEVYFTTMKSSDKI